MGIKAQDLPEIVVAAGLIWREDGMLLVSKRPEGGAHAGKWELPGGKLEPGETSEEALRREIEEELAIQVLVGPEFGRITHDYPTIRVTLIGHHALFSEGQPQPLGVAEFRWIDPDSLLDLTFPEANARLFSFAWRTPPSDWRIYPRLLD